MLLKDFKECGVKKFFAFLDEMSEKDVERSMYNKAADIADEFIISNDLSTEILFAWMQSRGDGSLTERVRSTVKRWAT